MTRIIKLKRKRMKLLPCLLLLKKEKAETSFSAPANFKGHFPTVRDP